MSSKIDGSDQALQCDSEVLPTPVKGPQPMACLDRVEQARVAEREYAGAPSAVEERLYRVLEAVPTPGALELELGGKLNHTGGKARVTAERDPSGEYLVRLAGQGQGAAAVGVASLSAGAGAALTYRVRTPEAAADLLCSLVAAAAQPLAGGPARVSHYAATSLERVELSLEAGVGLHGGVIKYGSLELSPKVTGFVDFNRSMLVTEQGVGGELLGRVSSVVTRSGFEGEVALKFRTETELPPDVLTRVANGELSVPDALRGIEATRKLVVEGESRAEFHAFSSPGLAEVRKLEAELDLDELFSHPTAPGRALKGTIKTMTSAQAVGTGIDLPGFTVLGRAAIFSVSEEHLFQQGPSLQKELDAKRSLHR